MRKFAASAVILASTLSLSGVAAAEPAAALPPRDLLLRNVHVVGSADTAPTSLRVRDGLIEAMGAGLPADGLPVVDGAGGYVMPGLIDAHVHLSVVPGSEQRGDSEALQRELRRQHLRGYLTSGVTTVADLGSAPEIVRETRAWLAAGEPGPRYLTLGPAFLTPGGYLTDMYPTDGIASVEDVEAHFALLQELGVDGIKVPLEKGFGPVEVWPVHSPEIRAAIRDGARARGLPIYVHGTAEDEQILGLEMGAHALVHTGFTTGVPSEAFIARVVDSGTFVMTTFAIMDAALIEFEPERLDDPFVRRAVPAVELATARDPESGLALRRTQIGMGMPWAPEVVVDALTWLLMDEAAIRGFNDSTLDAAVALQRAGAKLVIGSDSGNWGVVPYQFHGPTTVRELELLAQRGVPPLDVLAAATSTPAAMFGLEAEIGRVAVGMRADLIVLAADPVGDMRALRSLRLVVRDGEARTPEAWMAR